MKYWDTSSKQNPQNMITYKNTHRYWPGLILVVRVVLFLVFSVNVFGDQAISLLTIITSFCIQISLEGFTWYKKGILNIVEYSFFLNLEILSSATLFTTLTDRDQTAVVYTFVAIAFATFMIITIYHTGEGHQVTAETEVDRMGCCKN